MSELIDAAVLMPHAPILVPDVGRGREQEAAATVEAMRRAAERVLSGGPELVVIISPHAPRHRGAFGVSGGARLRGDFGQFGAENAALETAVAEGFVRRLRERSREAEVRVEEVVFPQGLDHGTLVPLWFLQEAGWKGPAAVISLPSEEDAPVAVLAAPLREAASGAHVAIVASGDMSHRLKPGAPAGFHPRAAEFDRTFLDLLCSRPGAIQEIDPTLRELAAEDVVASTELALAAVGGEDPCEVFSYEGPWGVGYAVADLRPCATAWAAGGEHLPAVARAAIADALGAGAPALPRLPAGRRAGVFVTLRSPAGELRGCIGSIEPRERDLPSETWRNAREAALRDPRFPPVSAAELSSLRITVSVLHPPEVVASEAELDPRRFGVIVSAGRWKRGLLLPGIRGIDSPSEQLRIAKQKAGLAPHDPVTIQRFRVDEFEEVAPPQT